MEVEVLFRGRDALVVVGFGEGNLHLPGMQGAVPHTKSLHLPVGSL